MVPEKKAKKKATGTRKSSRRLVVSDSSPDDPKSHSSPEDEEEEEEASPVQRGEERKGRPPQLGRPEGPRRGRPFFRTTPPTPKTAERNGHPGSSPWQSRKYPDTRITYGVPLLYTTFWRRIQSCSPPKAQLGDSSSGSLDSLDVNSTSLPTASSPYGRCRGGVPKGTKPGGGGPGGAAMRPPGLQSERG